MIFFNSGLRRESIQGITFVEVMVSLFLFTLVAGGLYATLLVGNVSWQNFETTVKVQQEVRRAMMMLSRDFRVAKNIVITGSPEGVVILFHHPKDGNVRYSWLKKGVDAATIIRQNQAGPRLISRDIVDFKVVNDMKAVTLSVSALAVSRQGKEVTFSLRHRVTKRK
jgi:Tfp pilus assembly protein PilW